MERRLLFYLDTGSFYVPHGGLAIASYEVTGMYHLTQFSRKWFLQNFVTD
jgi:hypothetical protein